VKLINILFCISAISLSFSQSNTENDSLEYYINKQISFHNLTVEKGLSQNSVVSIAQDSTGYLWFATQDGLNKYNGTSFKYYKKQFEDVTKATYSKLGKIYIDKENTIWIITNSGNLEKYDEQVDVFKPVSNINSASTIFQDDKLNIYIGTYGKGLLKIDSKSKDTIQLFNGVHRTKTVYQFLQNKDGIIVTASNDLFIFKNNTNEYNRFTSNKNHSNVNYSTVSQLKNKMLFAGTYGNGLFYSKPNETTLSQFTNLGTYTLPTNLNIESTLVDKRNRLWIATYGQGVFILNFELNTIKNYVSQNHNPYALNYNDTLCLFQDFTGTIWIGTDGAGLSYYDEHLSKFNLLTNNQTPENINVDVVRAIYVKDNNIYIGTSGKGLSTVNLNRESYINYTRQNSNLSSNRIMSLNIIEKELWIGHQEGGLNILDSIGQISTYNNASKVKLEANAIWSIYQDSQDNIWLCTRDNGLILFDKNKGVIEKHITNNITDTTISSNNIRIITEGKNGTLWIGTDDNGLCSLNINTKQIIRYNKIADKIKSLYFNKENDILWIGTNGNGIKKFDTKTQKIETFTTDQGLPNNVIYGIIPDKKDNLWLSSNRGITKFSINQATSNIVNYDNYDGLQAFEFNTGAYFKDAKNNIYFGGLAGINWFNPKQLTFNQTKPKTVISKFEIFEKEQSITQNNAFKYNQNTVTFTFSSLHFSLPERNLYKYKLVNHDNDWIESSNINTAHYTNLLPNNYEFQVISSNYDGVWNESPATFKFTINQPWYINNTAKITYILLLIAFAYSLYKYLKWRWKIKLQLELEHAEIMRLKDLDEFKTKLYTNISHEFRTPLTLILSPTENQLAKKNITEKDKNDLNLIQRNAKRLLNLVNQLLDLARLETGNLKLNIEQDNLSILINQLAASFKYKTKEKEIDFKTNIVNIPDAWFDKDIIEKIVTNLLSNAIKYTPKKGQVLLNTSIQTNYVLITVVNNGSSIKPEDLGKLFTRFYQVNSHADGVGIGLALVKELVSLSHGTLVANTINEDQIQFTVTIPINKEAFNDIDIYETNKRATINDTTIAEIDSTKTIEKNTNKPVLLIVEDDKHIRNYIASILEPDYKIIKAKNGKIGIVKAIESIPDLIISDILMPITNGIELCHSLKNNMLTSHIPIILLTAKIDEDSELKGLEVGADDFITKPFKSRILIKRISNLISLRKSLQKKYSQNTILKSKDIAITSLDEEFLSEVEIVFNKHLANPSFNAEVFSKHMHVSRMQLHRKLVALTGLTTTNFIRSQRLKQATLLLQKSDYTIAEIAYQIGFNTPSYFIRCFKEAYNCTPNDYISNT